MPNYTYVFNICGSLTSDAPESCTILTDYYKAASVNIDSSNSSSPRCEITGHLSDTSTKIQSLDSEDPSKGLSITYYGDYCSNPSTQKRFIIILECANQINSIPTSAAEKSHCVHTVTIPTIIGCPLQCPISQNKLCGGNGYCAYDNDIGNAKCFCNHGKDFLIFEYI